LNVDKELYKEEYKGKELFQAENLLEGKIKKRKKGGSIRGLNSTRMDR
jgi:hypothetical protein